MRKPVVFLKEVLPLRIRTSRLTITRFTPDMASRVHELSLDSHTRAFVPDEVFETVEEAAATVDYLMSCYDRTDGPLVYPILLDDAYIGYVQLVPIEGGAWELGYHVGEPYTRRGYATEAVCAFLPVIMARLSLHDVHAVCLTENTASVRVLEKCGFTRVAEGVAAYQGCPRSVVRFIYTA